MTEQLQEILNRKPSKWGNLTVKEFERDIKLLQERVQELEELTHKQGKVIIKQSDELDIFDQQNQRYKQALGRVLDFYPGVPNADFIPVEMLFEIKGIAYRALEANT